MNLKLIRNGLGKCLLLGTLSILLSYSLSAQNQVGNDIDGENAGDASGCSVSLSDDGLTMAVGAYSNDGNGSSSGHVRIYRWQNNAWIQLGNDIDGEAANDFSGFSVALSANGERLAIGAYSNDGGGSDAGHVRVYELNGNSWSKLGSDIDGEDAYNYSGESVSLNNDGTIVAIGALYNNGNGNYAGHARIFRWNGSSWNQLGSDIDGEAAGDNAGIVSLSGNGYTIAIGAVYNDGTANAAGHVRVFTYDSTNTTWNQLGSDIDGEAAADFSGRDISLNENGNIVAIGAQYNDGHGSDAGHVRVFQFSSNAWTQLGSDIDGDSADNYFGTALDLNGAGDLLSVGANGNSKNGISAGQARLFKYTNNNWVSLGSALNGEAASDNFGYSVNLSDDGTRLAVGAIGNDGNGNDAGHVRVFCVPSFADLNIVSCGSYTVPSGDETYTQSGSYFDTIPSYSNCDSILNIQVTITPNSSSTLNVNACNHYTVPSGAQTLTQSGTFYDTIPNAAGCDSLLTINLTIKQSSSSQLQVNACNSYTVPSGDETYSQGGQYFDTIPNMAGCDSIIQISLAILQASTSSFTVNACGTYQLPGGSIISQSGAYLDTIPSMSGCDSIMSIQVNLLQSSTSSIQLFGCGALTSPSGRFNYTSSGNYWDTISNASGCDSIMDLIVTIGQATSSTFTVQACGSYTLPSGKYVYEVDGTFTDTIPNASGCDSIMTITLDVEHLDLLVSRENNTLSADQNGASYQWLDCGNNLSPIQGADSKYFTPNQNGNYAVEITSGNCVDTSLCYSINNLSELEFKVSQNLKLYPNPTQGDLYLELPQKESRLEVHVYNAMGQVVGTHVFRHADHFALKLDLDPGVYLVQVKTASGKVYRKQFQYR